MRNVPRCSNHVGKKLSNENKRKVQRRTFACLHDRYTSCTKFEGAVPAGIWTKEHDIIILFKG